MHLKDQREELSTNLKDVPAFGDVDATSAHMAKIHQLEQLLVEEKERAADLIEETHAMQVRPPARGDRVEIPTPHPRLVFRADFASLLVSLLVSLHSFFFLASFAGGCSTG